MNGEYKMLKKVLVFISASILVFISVIYYNLERQEYSTLHYTDYIEKLDKDYNGDIDKIIKKLNEEIINMDNSKYTIGTNLLLIEHYYFIKKDYKEVIKKFIYVEEYLVEHKMNDELLYLYKMIISIYQVQGNYNKAYIYTHKGEKIAKIIYEKDKSEYNLSTLIEIRYLKAIVAFDIGMKEESKSIFRETEELRLNYKGLESIEIYINILKYYDHQENYNMSEKYAKKILDLLSDNNINDYELYLNIKSILARNYLKSKQIEKAIDIVNELQEYTINSYKIDNIYILCSMVYESYGKIEESIEYLKMAYYEIEYTDLDIKKVEIVYKILKLYNINKDYENIQKWCITYQELIEELSELKNTQYLVQELVNTDLEYANANIEILKLQKTNLIYFITILAIIIFTIVFILINLNKRKELEKKVLEFKLDTLNQQLKYQYSYYENIKNHQLEIRRLWHDMKNNIDIIYILINNNQFEEARIYLSTLNLRIINSETKIISNHKIVDTILHSKITISKSKNIDVNFDIKIPRSIGIDDFDISVILGNLLDNAIEACERIEDKNKCKYIKLSMGIKGDYLYINVENSSNNDILKKGNKLITSKKKSEYHGIGIESIKKSVGLYNGDIKIKYDEYKFSVFILLNIKNNNKS